MWLCLSNGFYSVTKHRSDPTRLCVRTRNRQHLEDIVECFDTQEIIHTPANDYPYRFLPLKEDWAFFLAAEAMNIDYGNFKATVKDHKLHSAFMAIWSVMRRYEDDSVTRKRQEPKSYFLANATCGAHNKGTTKEFCRLKKNHHGRHAWWNNKGDRTEWSDRTDPTYDHSRKQRHLSGAEGHTPNQGSGLQTKKVTQGESLIEP